MSAITHFQTYSQRENHVTNNTMLMLQHVYRISPRLLEGVIQALLEEDEVEIGPRFEQQVGAGHSIPDAVISQNPLNIYIEAKRGGGLDNEQLKRHMLSIHEKKHPKNSAFLIGLTSGSLTDDENKRLTAEVLELGISFVATTYSELLAVLGSACVNNPNLLEILDDYQAFIGGENLLPDQYRKIVAMLCGQSWQENVIHGAYFELGNRNPKWTRAQFLGIYHRKRISHVGRIVAVAVCKIENNKLIVESKELGPLTPEHRKRIQAIIDAATYYPGFAEVSHRYYLVDKFVETDVQKTSSGGMMGHRYLDVDELTKSDELQKDAPTEQVADMLNGTTYK